jgi:peroxiredoxin
LKLRQPKEERTQQRFDLGDCFGDEGGKMSDDFDNKESLMAKSTAADRVPVSESYQASQENQMRFPTWLKVVLLVAAVALGSVGYMTNKWGKRNSPATIGTQEADAPADIAKRQALADFSLTDADGVKKKLSDFKGSVVILSFWASWCTPCLIELPTFADIQRKFQDRGLKVLAVNVDEGDEGKTFAHDFWQKKSFPFPTYFDLDKSLAQLFQVDILPSNFVIDRQGRLVFSGFGANDWSSAQTTGVIETLLNEKLGDGGKEKPPDEGATAGDRPTS